MPIGYHFTADTLGDGSPIPAIGEKLVFDGPIEICRSGLHWSEHAIDALQNAPGKRLHLVKCSDPVSSQSDKHVSRERTIIKTIDATHLIHRFAADQAMSIAHLWNMPSVVREYLITLGDDKRDAAMVAARDAARDAAARVAAGDDATWVGVWGAARDAARDDFQSRVDLAFRQ